MDTVFKRGYRIFFNYAQILYGNGVQDIHALFFFILVSYSKVNSIFYIDNRSPDKSAKLKIIFLISQFNLLLWVLT